ncbi:hypothetical protein LWI28_013973 [Acer negundo]|uniref:Uncharacterized protein n=1 Tax=Acer negundo TaxID=4023 RepID=A0AAD5NXB6_ACENE|nr:hypothetical protein LWI28_013973 [Acer negundo]
MPRSKIVNFDEALGSTNPGVPPRRRVSRGTALNPNFEERMKVFAKKLCHAERGIDVSELGDNVLRPPLLTPSMLGCREVLGLPGYKVSDTGYRGTGIPGYRYGATSGYCVSGNQDDPDPNPVMMLPIASF